MTPRLYNVFLPADNEVLQAPLRLAFSVIFSAQMEAGFTSENSHQAMVSIYKNFTAQLNATNITYFEIHLFCNKSFFV